MKIKDQKYYNGTYWWYSTPMLRYFIPFGLGIGCYFTIDRSLWWYFISNLFLLVYLHLFTSQLENKPRVLFTVAGLSCIFLLGNQWSYYRYGNETGQTETVYKGLFEAKVASFKIGESWNQLRIKNISVVQMRDSTVKQLLGSAILRIKKTDQIYTVGDGIVFKGSLKPIDDPVNPKAFDFKKYWWVKDVYFQSFVEPEDIKRVHVAELHWVQRIRNRVKRVIAGNLKLEESRAIAQALLIGDKSELKSEVKQVYSKTGTMHVLAVSGLHVGIVASILIFILYPIRIIKPEIKKYIDLCALVGVWLFAYICNWSPSVTRAAIMISFLLVGLAIFENYYGLNIWAAAGFILLIYHPKYIFDVGFQFSFLAVLGILMCYRPIVRYYYSPNKIGYYLWKMTAITLSAQVFLIPLLIYYFHKLPLYFVPNSILAVLFVYCIVSLGFAVIGLDLILPGTQWLSQVWEFSIRALNRILEYTSSLPWSIVDHIWINKWEVVILFLVASSLTVYLNIKRPFYLKLSCWLFLIFAVSYSAHRIYISHHDYLVLYGDRSKQLDLIIGGKTYSITDNLNKELSDHELLASSYLRAVPSKRIRISDTFSADDVVYTSGFLFTDHYNIVILKKGLSTVTEKLSRLKKIHYLIIDDRPSDYMLDLDKLHVDHIIRRYNDHDNLINKFRGDIIAL